MKLFCRCDEPWITVGSDMYEAYHCNTTRQIASEISVNCSCGTQFYWYSADYENMMFDLRNMNS